MFIFIGSSREEFRVGKKIYILHAAGILFHLLPYLELETLTEPIFKFSLRSEYIFISIILILQG